MVKSLVQFLDTKLPAATHHGVSQDMRSNYNKDMQTFESALSMLSSQIEDLKSGTNYFRERAKNQYSVVR